MHVIGKRVLGHLEQQLFAVDVGRVAGVCARNHRRVVQLSAAQVVDAVAVDGERLYQRALSGVERLDVDSGDVAEIAGEGDVSDVAVGAQSGFVRTITAALRRKREHMLKKKLMLCVASRPLSSLLSFSKMSARPDAQPRISPGGLRELHGLHGGDDHGPDRCAAKHELRLTQPLGRVLLGGRDAGVRAARVPGNEATESDIRLHRLSINWITKRDTECMRGRRNGAVGETKPGLLALRACMS